MNYLIDLDEVIVKCNEAIFKHYGIIPSIGEWEQIPVSEDDIHEYIGDHDFWVSLGKTPWADDLIKLISDTTDNWSFLSIATKYPGSWSGKAAWIKRCYPHHFDRLILCREKFRLASRQHCLIDDRKCNINSFLRRGGSVIPFPSTNGHYDWSAKELADPVEYVKNCLNKIETQRIVKI